MFFARGTESLQTLSWREVDSNFRFLEDSAAAHALHFGIRPLKRYSIFSLAVICFLCRLAGCSAAPVVGPYDGSASRTEVIYVISGGWHTELGLPVGAINGPLAALKAEFPSAGYLVFGWGARDYYMARNPGIGDILRALAPGPAVMLVIPLQTPPEAFFGGSNVALVHVSPDGLARLSEHLWSYLAIDKERPPRRIGTGPFPQSIFYASTGTYNLGHTCNTWTAEGLQVSGLPVSAAGVVFASQVLDQVRPLLEPAHEHTQNAAGPFSSFRPSPFVKANIFRGNHPGAGVRETVRRSRARVEEFGEMRSGAVMWRFLTVVLEPRLQVSREALTY